jgi:uncharacterized protein YfaS (alpha-2-macroglobulin family)
MRRLQCAAGLLLGALSAASAFADEPATPRIVQATLTDSSLDIEFSEPMLSWPSGSAPIGFALDPTVELRCYWNDDTHLSCNTESNRPDIRRATRYRLSITGEFWSQAGTLLPKQTLLLDSMRPELHAGVAEWKDGRPIIALTSNMAVDAASLRSVLSMASDDGSPIAFDIRPQSTTRDELPRWTIAITNVASADHVATLRIHPGLRSSLGQLTGNQSTILVRARIGERFRLRSATSCASPPESWSRVSTKMGADPTVRIVCPARESTSLEFSEALSANSFAAWKASLPPGVFLRQDAQAAYSSTEDDATHAPIALRPGAIVSVASDRPGQTFSFDLPATITGESGAPIDRVRHVTFVSGDYTASLGLLPARLLQPAGATSPEMISMLNQPELSVDQYEIGASDLRSVKAKLDGAPKNMKVNRAPPDPARDVRQRGGLVSGVLQRAAAMAAGGAHYSIAYAAFNITSSFNDGQYVVWVTDWNKATAIANANVELLQAQPATGNVSVLASATTGADGVAMFELPKISEPPAKTDSVLLLRATRDGRRSILPFDHALATEYLPKHWHATSEGSRRTWGVADRQLYRSGETVHYRVWTRERSANHLRSADGASSIRLELATDDYSGRHVSEFDMPLDAWGSANGELKLPATLRDGTYCIRAKSGDEHQGACFRVAGYHVSAQWTELHLNRELAFDGETIALDASSGYYSGGPAVGARTEIQALLTPLRLEEAYPQFGAFTFIDPYDRTAGSGGESYSDNIPVSKTDAHGRVHADLVLETPKPREFGPALPIPFGKLEFTASVVTSDNSASANAPATARLSRHRRFVGIKTREWLLRNDQDPEIEAVVISADGKAIADAPVQVTIEEYKEGDASIERNAPLARCELRSGSKVTCPFRAPHSGAYVFRASSEGAADTALQRYAWVGMHRAVDVESSKPRLIVDSRTPGDPTAHLVLQQPFASAEVLFTIEHGRVLEHWTQHVDAPVSKVDVPIQAAWAPGVTIKATLLDATGAAFDAQRLDAPLAMTASIDWTMDARAADDAITLELDRTHVRPADEVVITLHNRAASRRQITLAVVDDAARALVPDLVAETDPQGSLWLGQFTSWSLPSWYGLSDWTRRIGGQPTTTNSLFEPEAGEKLETITVTGSNITPADIFPHAQASDHSLGQPLRAADFGQANLRSRFRESALWDAGIELEPGASHEVKLRLPDNLTRWRVLAWSADNADAFGLVQQTIEASLPIEVRADVPVRVFEGDTTTFAASVRNHGESATTVQAMLLAKGAGVDISRTLQQGIGANAELRLAASAQAGAIGNVAIEARAKGGTAADGVAANVEVASTVIHRRLPVAGWLPAEGVQLVLPALPSGAMHARLRVEASRGLLAFAAGWVDALRVYPHRCWEQILSRAVGAAAAIRLGLAGDWPDADAVIREALDSAGQYQDHDGHFHFFVGDDGADVFAPDFYLTAYTVRSFEFLGALGYDVPGGVDKRAREAIAKALAQKPQGTSSTYRNDELAAMAAALPADIALPADTRNQLWNARAKLSWFSRANLARAFARHDPHDARSESLLQELRDAGSVRGMRRIVDTSKSSWVFATPLTDQCAVLGALTEFDHTDGARRMQDELRRGMFDLYAGGASTLDTQTLAQCLITLASDGNSASSAMPAHLDIGVGATTAAIELGTGQARGEWSGELAAAAPKVTVHSPSANDALMSFVASIEYDIDGRKVEPAATAFGLERSYSVLERREWKDVPAAAIRDGDWVRITLRVSNRQLRRFVAVTDTVPGGLQPTDLALSGVAGVDVQALGGRGSFHFPARQVDDRTARFYAEMLPPGTHEIHYYARAVHAGNYAALPAVAELMYGSAGVANTASKTLTIGRDTKR